MDKIFKFLNNGKTDVKAPWRNWFFATTVAIVLLNVILYAALGGEWHQVSGNYDAMYGHWHDTLFFTNLLQTFLSAFSHANWQHTLLNMLCFAVCGIYLERKLGSVKLFGLVMCFAFFGGCATAANDNSISFHGFSGVNYAIYAYVLVDYLFCVLPRDGAKSKVDIISGGVMLALIYWAACFNGGVERFSFSWYPYDAMTNLGHYTSYFVGLIISVFLCTTRYVTENKLKAAAGKSEA